VGSGSVGEWVSEAISRLTIHDSRFTTHDISIKNQVSSSKTNAVECAVNFLCKPLCSAP